MRPSDRVRVKTEDIKAIDRLGIALGRMRDTKGWTRTDVVSWLLEVSGIQTNEPLPWLCGRCLRRIFWPAKTRLMLGRRGECPHCGAGYVLQKHGPPNIGIFDRKDWRAEQSSNGGIVHRPAVSDQLSHTLQARMKAGETFELWFVW
ncbi:MAG: hypothetical protein V3W37_03045 [Candidatus Binatia bacterium]